MPSRKNKKCVKCELHGKNEFYTEGHKRRCPFRQCPCVDCKEHDQLLDIMSRERTKRNQYQEKMRAERLLPRDTVKLLRRQMEIRRLGESNTRRSVEQPFVFTSDAEGYATDVDDHIDPHDDLNGVHGYLSDELPGPEHFSGVYTPPTDIPTLRHSIFDSFSSSLGINAPTPTSPPGHSFPSTSSNFPVSVTHPSSDSETDQTQKSLTGRNISFQEQNKDSDEVTSNSEILDDSEENLYELKSGLEDFDEGVKQSEAEYSNDGDNIPSELDNNNNDQTTFTKVSEVTPHTKTRHVRDPIKDAAIDYGSKVEDNLPNLEYTRDEELSKFKGNYEDVSEESGKEDYFDYDPSLNFKEGKKDEPQINNSSEDDLAKNKHDIDQDQSGLPIAKKRPKRWDVPPPGTSPGRSPSPPPPPVLHVAQISIPPHLMGLLVGRRGHFIRKLSLVSNCVVSLGPVFCTVEGSSGGVEVARRMVADRLKLRMF